MDNDRMQQAIAEFRRIATALNLSAERQVELLLLFVDNSASAAAFEAFVRDADVEEQLADVLDDQPEAVWGSRDSASAFLHDRFGGSERKLTGWLMTMSEDDYADFLRRQGFTEETA